MTQTIIPRPIAWVLSENKDETLNLAPFSYFNAVCSDPPLCMLSMGKKPDGNQKDTVTNLQVGAYCIVHIAQAHQADLVTATAATMAYGESEVSANNIPLSQHEEWPLKRISTCPIAYLCKVHSVQTIGNVDQHIIFVEALELYVDDNVGSEQGKRIVVDASKVDPLARLGASQYANLGEVFSKARPK
ncbi:flavin reductase family protein [Glaciecola sp. XM2]|jgi:flavin reductase (DIM6/NTAB) family NADH-FMN oxidoreductase RutF|uniref:flavin reductase family protein n=1 Tax=Glaciecola sp. XM2 TaxID=1914931 RepID=UPI003317BBD9